MEHHGSRCGAPLRPDLTWERPDPCVSSDATPHPSSSQPPPIPSLKRRRPSRPPPPPLVAAAPATPRRGQAGGALPGHGDTAGGFLLPLTFSPSPKGGKGMEGIRRQGGGSAQIRSRTGGPPSLEIVHGGPTRLRPWTEMPETLANRGGPTPQPPRKGRAPTAGRLRRPPTMVARIWTSCCSYCFRWTRTSPPSWLMRLPTPSSYPLAWCDFLLQ
ncbi:hypothetical protein VPH35_014125 [Triticum aestivum]